MGKAKPPQPLKVPNAQAIPSLDGPKIMQNAQNLKNRFSQLKGQSDQSISDGVSDLVNGFLQMLSQVVQSNQQLEARIKELQAKPAPPAETK